MCLLRKTLRPCIVYSNCFSLTKSASGVLMSSPPASCNIFTTNRNEYTSQNTASQSK